MLMPDEWCCGNTLQSVGMLDEARKLRDEGRSVIAGMQADYVAQSGVQSLKIKHNNVLGYFIEVTAIHAEKMMSPPLSETFIHRQTLANAVRFTTVELSELESKIVNAGARALEIEMRLFAELRAAAEQLLAPVKHRRLSWRYGRHRLGKAHLHDVRSVAFDDDLGRRGADLVEAHDPCSARMNSTIRWI